MKRKKAVIAILTTLAGILMCLGLLRERALTERAAYPFEVAAQTSLFLSRLISNEPPGALRPPHERDDWESARRFYRHEVEQALGLDLFPDRPLNERSGAATSRERYRVTPLSFDTLPGIRTHAALYLPTEHAPPFPAVMIAADEEIGAFSIRRLATTLATAGIAVLTLEPPGSGARKATSIGDETLLLTRFTPLSALIREQEQAVALLRTRPDIAPHTLVIAGIGPGADAAIVTAARNPAVTAVAAVAPATSLHALAADDHPHRLLITPHRTFALHHLFSLVAPRPFLLLAADTPVSFQNAHEDTIRRTAEMYRFLGAPEAFIPDSCDAQRLDAACRRRLYTFITDHLSLPDIEEEADDLPTAKELAVPAADLAAIPLTELARREALIFRDLARSRRDETGPERYAREIAETIRDLAGAGLWGPPPPLDATIHEVNERKGVTSEATSIAADHGLRLPLLLHRPPQVQNIVILVSEQGDTGSLARDLSREGVTVLELALRRFADDGLFDRLTRPVAGRRGAVAALIAGIPAAAQQSTDIVAALSYLAERFGEETVAGLYAEGPVASLAALLAAHRSDRIGWIALNGIPVSLIPSETGDNALLRELALRLPGILRYGDIADLIATLAPRRVLVTGLVGPDTAQENESSFARSLWEKRHLILLPRADRKTLLLFLKTRGTSPAP